MSAPRGLLPLLTLLALALAPAAAHAQVPAPEPTGGAVYGSPAAPAAPTAAAPTVTPAPAATPEALPVVTVGGKRPVVAGSAARLLPDGSAAAPAAAPAAVQAVIWAANALQAKPYRYGGGHRSFLDSAYDCSGTVSFALHGGSLLASPLDSGSFIRWGAGGAGRWITVYANAGHAYAVIAGLRLDTSAVGVYNLAGTRAAQSGPRWRPAPRPATGFKRRHPVGL